MILIASQEQSKQFFTAFVENKTGKLDLTLEIGYNLYDEHMLGRYGLDPGESRRKDESIGANFFRFVFYASLLKDVKFTYKHINDKMREVKGTAKLKTAKEIDKLLNDIFRSYQKKYAADRKVEKAKWTAELKAEAKKNPELRKKITLSDWWNLPSGPERTRIESLYNRQRFNSKIPHSPEVGTMFVNFTVDIPTLKKSVYTAVAGVRRGVTTYRSSLVYGGPLYKKLIEFAGSRRLIESYFRDKDWLPHGD